MGSEAVGAYGFRLVLADGAPALPSLAPAPADAPEVRVEWRHAACLAEASELSERRVLARKERGPSLEVLRDPASITMEFPEQVNPEALVHPQLTGPISILCRWRGDLTLHAGAFLAHERAWAVMGEREAGKSTALAHMAAAGLPLMADDLLVLGGDVVRAGPACVDLRPDVAERMPGARFVGEVAGRARYRLPTGGAPAEAPLGGIFLMGWSDDGAVSAERVPAAEAIRVLYAQEYIGLLGPADPSRILDLLAIPMWRIRRPRDWSFTEETAERMLAATAAEAG